MLELERSRKLFDKGDKNLVGSVNSPVRSFKAVDTGIIFAEKAAGAYIWDVDGNKYVDYIMSWGVKIFGHAYKPVVNAAISAIKHGTSFGLTSENEIILAGMVKKHYASIEKIRFVTSGTESCMTAVRLARGFTRKSKIIKFDGCYHGHYDGLLVKSGSGNLTFGIPSGEGISAAAARDTISIPFNDISVLKSTIEKNKGEIACVIVEPVPCNTGVIIPKEGYLRALADITKAAGIVLIFDEVITGFRLSLGGAQGLFNIKPDLTCLGKIIGGGFPVGAVGGRADIMDMLAPSGPVYQAGTLSGNPVSIAAGIKMIQCLETDKKIYSELDAGTQALVKMLRAAAKNADVPAVVNTIGSVFSIFFTGKVVSSHADTLLTDKAVYSRFFSALCNEKILFPPSAFEACFVSQAHTDSVIEKTGKAFKKAFRGGKL